MVFQFGPTKIDVDIEQTKAFYNSERVVTPGQTCDCYGCRNFDKAILAASPAVLAFLESLGIDPRKPHEVIPLGDFTSGETCKYDGWYHVVGTIAESPTDEWGKYVKNDYVPDAEADFTIWFQDDPELLWRFPEAFPRPVLELFFCASLTRCEPL